MGARALPSYLFFLLLLHLLLLLFFSNSKLFLILIFAYYAEKAKLDAEERVRRIEEAQKKAVCVLLINTYARTHYEPMS